MQAVSFEMRLYSGSSGAKKPVVRLLISLADDRRHPLSVAVFRQRRSQVAVTIEACGNVFVNPPLCRKIRAPLCPAKVQYLPNHDLPERPGSI